MVDEEFYVGFLLLCLHALERIGGYAASVAEQSLLVEFAGGYYSVGNLYCRHIAFLVADVGIEGKIHLALLHFGHIVERGLHGVTSSHLVAYGLVVAHHLLSLECGGVSLRHLSVGIAQLWSYRHDSFPLHVLLRESAVDGGRHLSCLCFKRIWGHGEVVGRERTELRAR